MLKYEKKSHCAESRKERNRDMSVNQENMHLCLSAKNSTKKADN